MGVVFDVVTVLSSFSIILLRERERERERERAGCFSLFVFLLPCAYSCSVPLPRGVLGWSVIVVLLAFELPHV